MPTVQEIFPQKKKLGFGLMRLPLLREGDPASIDLEQVKKMVDLFLARGFSYFDTALMYCGRKSQNAVKTILSQRYPRDRFSLATKLHCEYFQRREERDAIFQQQLEDTGVTFFDYYLLHDISADHYPVYEAMDCFSWLLQKKREGLVRHVGFSFHDQAALLERVLTEHPEMEFVQLQLNYLDWENQAVQSRKCYETCLRHGKPVIVMEPVRGGNLAHLPPEAEALLKAHHPHSSLPSWAIRFAASPENVGMVLSGMSNLAQMEDNLSFMEDFHPLDDQERHILANAVESIRNSQEIPCTGCAYCLDGCPRKIPIPRCFSLYNSYRLEERCHLPFRTQQMYYRRMALNYGTASQCLNCHRCERLCPQHLPIPQLLKKVAQVFEK